MVMLIEDWQGQPRKNMDILMAEDKARQDIENPCFAKSSTHPDDITLPPKSHSKQDDPSTPLPLNSSINLTAQQLSDAAKARQVIGEISFSQSPQSLHARCKSNEHQLQPDHPDT
jgi:hypothetical protein